MKPAHTLIALATTLALAACNRRDPVADEANNVVGLPSPNHVAGAEDGSASADGSAPHNVATTPANKTQTTQPAAAIPAQFHGRWGLAPGDCSSTNGDAKGLLVVNSGTLQFYESGAVPVAHVRTSKDSFSADFAFTGEGQSWTKFETLQMRTAKLVRTESNPMASFTYARCE